MSTESFIEILTINSELPSTNKKLLMINISASEDDKVIKTPSLSAIYLCYLVVLMLLLTAVLSLLTILDKNSNTFSYYLSATKDLS